jgi:hypothetical protein
MRLCFVSWAGRPLNPTGTGGALVVGTLAVVPKGCLYQDMIRLVGSIHMVLLMYRSIFRHDRLKILG